MLNYLLYCLLLAILLIVGGIFIAQYMVGVLHDREYSQKSQKVLISWLNPVERFIYRCAVIDPAQEMNWKNYTAALLVFNGIGFLFLFLLQLIQGFLPLNPNHLGAVRWDTALNTAISFMTNTNWQSYGGETTMSYLTQMFGLTVQNFLSAATGIVALLTMVRGFIRKNTESLGNFWVDLTRVILYILLPLSIMLSIVLTSQGVIQTLRPSVVAQQIENGQQTIAVGPVASQVAIKELGSNGGGFFNTNSAHPFENPNLFTNFLEMFAILLLPISCVFLFGFMLKNRKQGRTIFIIMSCLFVVGLAVALLAESGGNPVLKKMHITSGLSMEGKEVRFGVFHSTLWGVATTTTSNGSVNSMHDSALPLTGLVYLFNMGIGEAIYGGVGVGLIGMIFYIFISMFIAGLMIGRTSEFIGKKLGPFEMIMAIIAILGPVVVLLLIAGLAIASRTGLTGLYNSGAHGLSEILYAASSACGNNGSAFAGLNSNTPFYNLLLAFGMLVGRFATIIPALAVAGSLARKKIVPTTQSTFPTTSVLFIIMVVAVVLIVGALTFFPFFSIGPILEHLIMYH
jgi:K+-transporting ATPase ATPase A chain